ncbi:putative T7SS-secreted protein [Kitasatospora purpeofusca]|uniref:putative T7SS-secreted protein n=1 Tax=Kitasatospora purpeofusca TaxID=67352 RepID=UPI003820220A
MPQRPTDWNAIGLSADPTPGDPDRIDEVQRSLADLGRTAREIDDALAAVLDKTGQGAFTGQTADALRDKISGPLRAFVQSVADGFENSARALTTYSGVVRDQQWRADNALSQGRGLAQDDTRRTELASTARQAGTAQDEAGRTAGSALSSAARGIKQPVSDCDLFWEAFQWLAIALILPALIFGGPIALLAIGVNLAIFVKTAVDFSQGKASALDLFLSGLGMIAPTTKGLPLLKLISAGAKFTWTGIKGVAQAVGGFFRGVFTGGGSHAFAFLPGLADLARMTGGWVKAGGLWVLNGVTRLPHFAGVTFRASGIAVVNGVKGLPALVRGLPANLGKFGSASWDFARAQLGGAKWLRLVLPVDAAEIGRYGLRGALRIGLWERGVLGNFRYGAPLLGTAGRTAAAVPVPPPVHTVDALVDLSRADLAKVRVGDWAGPRRLEIPHLEPSGSGLSYTRPSDFRLHNDLADRLSLAPDAVRKLDALLDTPIRDLRPVGSWTGGTVVTPGGLHVETGLGVGAAPGGLHGIGGLVGGAPAPTPVHLADTLTVGGPATVHAPNLQTQALALHQTGGAPTALGTGALHTAAPAAPAVHTADLLSSSTVAVPHLSTGTLPTAALHGGGTGLPSVVTGAVTVPGLGTTGSGAHLNGALDLLATGSPLNRADAPVFSTGGNLGDHSTRALAASQVNLHLGEFAAPRVTPATTAALPPVHAVTPPTALVGVPGPGGVTDLGGAGAGAHGGLGRVDEALGLLQPGGPGHGPAQGLAGLVPAAPAPLPSVVVGPTPLPPVTPLTQGPVAPLPPVAPAHPAAGSAHDLPTVPGTGGHGGPERLTGAQLDRLWREQGDRVAALFGASDDPGRGARLDAWADLTLARHDLGRAERLLSDLRARPGGGSRPSPVVMHAEASVDAAAFKVDVALDRVTGLGVDPVRMDRDLAALTADSLRERPRLLGGSEGGGGVPPHVGQQPQLAPHPAPQHGPAQAVQPPQHVQAQPPVPHHVQPQHVQPQHVQPQPPAPQPVVLALADQGTAGPNGLRVESTVTPNGTVHRVLDSHHVPDPMLQPTPRPGGGFDLYDTRLGTTHSYDGGGRLVAEDLPLTGLDGGPVGLHVHTDFDAQGAATHRVLDPNGATGLQAAPRPGGGFDLRDPATGGHRGFDHGGGLVEEGRPLLRGDGTPFGPVLLLGHDNGTVTRSLSGGGHTLTELPGGGGLRVTDPATGSSALYDHGGAFRAEGLALGDAAGLRGHRFATRQGGGFVVTDVAGAVVPGSTAVGVAGGGVRVTEAVSGGSVRFGADGLQVERGVALADGAGVRGARFLEGNPPRVTDVSGAAVPGLSGEGLAGGGWRVTDAVSGVSTRYTAQGGAVERGVALADGAGVRGARFLEGTPPRVTDVSGAAVPGLSGEGLTGGGWRVTDPVSGVSTRYTPQGAVVESGVALADGAGVRGVRFLEGNPPRVTDVTGGPTGLSGEGLAGGGWRVTDPVSGVSTRYTAQGAVVESGVALADGAGARGGRFVVPQGGGGHALTDAVGAVLPERVVVHPGGGFRVEGAPAVPGGGAPYERFAANGTPTAGGRQLLDGNGTVVGHLERPVPAPGHPAPAGQPAWLDAAFQPDATRVVTADGAGLRVTAPGGSYRVFDDAGRLTDDAARLHAPGGGALDQWVVVHTPPGGPRTLEVLDATGTPVPNLTAADRPGGGFQVTDAAADNGFVRYGADGGRLETGTALRGPDGNPDRTFAVLPPPGPGGAALPGHLEDAAGLRIPERAVTVRADGGLQVSVDRPNGPRHGEFTAHAPGDGRITHQGFNVVDGGRRTDHQYVVDHTPAAGATWSRQPHPAAAAPPPAGTGAFHHGRVETLGGGNRIRLLSSTYTPVEVFERRVLPGGGLLDSFRRTDTLLFGDLDRRTVWTQWDAAGGLGAHGTRRYDTSGFGWRDLDHRGNPVHEYRDGLQKTGGVTGHTFAVRNADRSWTWHRFDGAGQELAHGPRTPHRDSGWTDRLADGTVVQKQWGMGHGPGKAGHFLEHTWQGGGVRQTWERHSPHGKEVGKREVLATDNAVLTTSRWSEQRPPLWVRRHLVGAGGPQGVAAHLADDTRYQVFLWDKAGGVNPGGGVRYVGMDGAAVDLGADGRFVRSTGKLHGGTTLKVGDHANPPAHPPTNPAHLPWEEPGRRGYRVEVVPPAGAGRDHPLWQDRFSPDGGANWQVAREGFADGSVREYRVPPQVDPATGNVQGRGTHAWVQRDAHGNLTGSHDIWQDPQGNRLEVTGTGRPDAGRWTWTATDHLGHRTTGRREFFRGSDDPRLPWDDSFRDLDAGGALLRERNMLDGGRWVDSWRGAAPPGGGQRWHTAKYEANGTAVDFGAGQQVRRWWNADTRAWQDGWTARTRHFRDEFRPAAGGPALTLREVPPHLALGEGPLRVRQYVPGGNAPHPAGSWKEFDHGAVVRERKPLGDGTFLEKDAWRGQWRRYDQHQRIVAQRTDSGLVWETGPGGNLRVTGNEYDFRGPLTEIRGFGRRVREANRLPWGDSVEVRVPRMQNALAGVPGLPAARNGVVPLGEALYQPYWKVLAKKVALEFGQEFVLEFGANLAVNGIVAAANNKPFTGKDVLKSFANAAVGAGVKSLVSTGMHELRGSAAGGPKSVFGNVDGGKHERRHPNNHDKNWANEWAGNETPTRWRGGTYDFFYNAALGGVVGWVNGAMNASVWGVTGADGKTHVLSGMDAFLDGGIAGLAGLTTASSAALAKNAVIAGGGSRLFHRQGFAEFWLQLPFKIFEKTVTSLWLTNAYRASIDPAWYRAPLPAPAPAPVPAPAMTQGQQP